MSGWHYFATRLHGNGTETVIATEIPLEGVSPRVVLSGPDDFGSPSVPIEIERLRGEDGKPVFLPWSTAFYAEKDGLIRAGGLLTDAVADGPSLSLQIDGWTAYLEGMPYSGDEKWIEADPLDIARHIWAHVQSQPQGNIGLVLDDTTSPVRIGQEEEEVEFETEDGEEVSFTAGPYRLNYFSTHDLAREFDDLAQSTPFDYAVEHYWHGDEIRHRLRLGYPRLGRRRKDLRFVVGENITEPSVDLETEEFATEVWLLGAGEGSKMVRGIAVRETDRLRRPVVISDETVSSAKRARQIAEAELAHRLGAEGVESIEVIEHPNAPVGSWQVGDEIRIQGGGSGWAGGLDLWVRVLDFTYATADRATLTVMRAGR